MLQPPKFLEEGSQTHLRFFPRILMLLHLVQSFGVKVPIDHRSRNYHSRLSTQLLSRAFFAYSFMQPTMQHSLWVSICSQERGSPKDHNEPPVPDHPVPSDLWKLVNSFWVIPSRYLFSDVRVPVFLLLLPRRTNPTAYSFSSPHHVPPR